MNVILIWSFILIILFIFQSNHAVLVGDCNTCNNYGIACVNEIQFKVCGENNDDLVLTCMDGSVCSGSELVCESGSEVKPICYDEANKCSSCNASTHIACIDDITYTYCCDDNIPNMETLIQCPEGYVCNLESSDICTSGILTEPSCPLFHNDTTTTESTTRESTDKTNSITESMEDTSDYTSTTEDTTERTIYAETTIDDTTTTSTKVPACYPSDPSIFCSNRKAEGYFIDETDQSCKKYFICFRISGQYYGLRSVCAGYFNDTTKECQIDKPINCANRATN